MKRRIGIRAEWFVICSECEDSPYDSVATKDEVQALARKHYEEHRHDDLISRFGDSAP